MSGQQQQQQVDGGASIMRMGTKMSMMSLFSLVSSAVFCFLFFNVIKMSASPRHRGPRDVTRQCGHCCRGRVELAPNESASNPAEWCGSSGLLSPSECSSSPVEKCGPRGLQKPCLQPRRGKNSSPELSSQWRSSPLNPGTWRQAEFSARAISFRVMPGCPALVVRRA